MTNIAEIATQLVAHGRDPLTPVLVVSRGTLPDQRWLVSSLRSVAADTRKGELSSPTLFVIGEVVTLAELYGASGYASEMDRPAIAT